MIRKSLPEAIAYLPSELNGVTETDWANLTELHCAGKHENLFGNSFANGQAFDDVGDRVASPSTGDGRVVWATQGSR